MSQRWRVRLPAGHTNSKDEDVCECVQNDQSATAGGTIWIDYIWSWLGWKILRSTENVFFGKEKWLGKRSENWMGFEVTGPICKIWP